jgi:MSHA pilin protein MshD
MCIERRQRGMSLIELIVAMVVIGVALAGILGAFNLAVMNSADPLVARQEQALADALLEEVEQGVFTYCDADDANVATATSAAACASQADNVGPESGDTRPYDNVNDYVSAFATAKTIACTDLTASIAAPGGYACTITETAVALNTLTAASGDALRIVVAVTGPDGSVSRAEGYRVRHAPK